MAQVSSKQQPADDVMLVGDQALRSELLDAEQTKKIRDGMYGLNGRWNTLNIDVIEKEMRLVNLNLNDHVIQTAAARCAIETTNRNIPTAGERERKKL